MSLKEQAKQLPKSPGVYLMRDKHHDLLYVGKANKLNERVSSYFTPSNQRSKRIERMIHTIHEFETISVDTELDALLLECELIQTYRPPYNVQLNHFTSYNYLLLSEEPPNLTIQLEPTEDSLGPFSNYKKIPDVKRIIEETYQFPCRSDFEQALRQKIEPSLTLSMTERIAEIRAFLLGQDRMILLRLEARLQYYSERLQFERAAALTEDIDLIQRFIKKNELLIYAHSDDLLMASLPLPDRRRKFYLLYQGAILETKIYKDTPKNKERLEQRWRNYPKPAAKMLTKEKIDQILILYSYMHRRMSYEKLNEPVSP